MSSEQDFIYRFEPGDPGAPALLLLHGTGGDENDLLPLGRMLSERAALLSPRGKVLEHGMPRFFRRLAMGMLDVEDLKVRTHDLADFVTHAAEQHELDRSRMVAVGLSNGANIASSMLLLRPEVVRRAVLLRPMVPFEPEALPDLAGTRVLIAAGRQDSMVPHDHTERLREMLVAAGADVTLHVSGGGHVITMDDVTVARGWLEQEAASGG